MNELETYIKNQKVIIRGLVGELEPLIDEGEDDEVEQGADESTREIIENDE